MYGTTMNKNIYRWGNMPNHAGLCGAFYNHLPCHFVIELLGLMK